MQKKIISAVLALLLAAPLCIPGLSAVFSVTAEAAYTVSEAYRGSGYYAAVNAVTLTGDARADLLSVARSQLGYIEGGQPGDFGGSGSTGVRDNYTEYIYWYFGDASAHGDNYAWCAAFVSWCANKAGISEETVPKFARVQSEGEATFKSWGRFRSGDYVPSPGDLIFYAGHVGIVEKADGETVTSIEGNYQDCVCRRTNYAGSKSILGYGVLSGEPAPWPAFLEYPGALQRVGSSGLVTVWLQKTLNDLGYPCGNPDGIFGNNTKNAVVAFQTDNGLDADGLAGAATWRALWDCLHAKYPDAPVFSDDVHTPAVRSGFAPTCAVPGQTDAVVCAVCGAVLTEPAEIPAAGHCDEDGDGLCDVCCLPLNGTQSEGEPCVCGEIHTGFFAPLIRFFHRIVWFFRQLISR